jgi:hypothetical protein
MHHYLWKRGECHLPSLDELNLNVNKAESHDLSILIYRNRQHDPVFWGWLA